MEAAMMRVPTLNVYEAYGEILSVMADYAPDFEPWWDWPKQRKPRSQRKPTLASVAKQASKAALEVARYEVRPDGTVVVVTGKSESTEPNPWLADLNKVTKQ
jgi:hypothetical protein